MLSACRISSSLWRLRARHQYALRRHHSVAAMFLSVAASISIDTASTWQIPADKYDMVKPAK
ncbi:hypothetical protein KCP70_23390 [Salmonella enterica subsp. enterica]|nr:hypothetical protein KCP70_23390 [Salmonella enterica subsp. enterica]